VLPSSQQVFNASCRPRGRVALRPARVLAAPPLRLSWRPLLNLGVISAVIGLIIELPLVPLVGHLTQGLAAGAFALHAWPRVKIFGADR
jgi:hypothetical protein